MPIGIGSLGVKLFRLVITPFGRFQFSPLAEEYEIHPPDEKQIQALEDDLDQEKL
jgi:hypothetical protein